MTRSAHALAVAAALAALAVGCTGTEENGGRGTESPDGHRSPFTGEPAEAGRPVLAIKVDNAPEARPHTGLDAADLIYVEPIEAGFSRLVAIYSSDVPDLAGPVRSARESDLDLLRQFGEPALAFSGAQRAVLDAIADAPVFDEPPDALPDAYERHDDREAPHNLFVHPRAVLDAAPDASDARDIGFRFGAAPGGGAPETERSVSYPNAEFTFTWSPDEKRWRVALDGDETDVTPATVVLQEVEVTESDLHDVNGNFTPFTETVGSGDATVLRGGQAFEAEWDRDHKDEGTDFTTPDGEPMTFAEGQVWVVFVPR
ncbi:DUF3048 domain-containing protein [Streptomyces sp. SBT349]|uniref:DUF3048 domain-containing protein n=1 Tax=Streptomyces sp. SBT349 TaxID=1580539 RepID=UPI00069FDB99|nr:DUF3048 domain-containing protein [Streptomyces sp. SBT349]